jgi:hypothetical protein
MTREESASDTTDAVVARNGSATTTPMPADAHHGRSPDHARTSEVPTARAGKRRRTARTTTATTAPVTRTVPPATSPATSAPGTPHVERPEAASSSAAPAAAARVTASHGLGLRTSRAT